MNSQVITYPSTVKKQSNITLVIIDPDVKDVAEMTAFCQTSNKEYDLYLYRHDLDDLQWLSSVAESADAVLVNETSNLTLENLTTSLKFGSNQQINTPLTYLQQVDNI